MTNENNNISDNISDDDNEGETIRLDNFIKLTGIVGTGGQAKLMIQNGTVLVNGEVETRRRRKLSIGDSVVIDGEEYQVQQD